MLDAIGKATPPVRGNRSERLLGKALLLRMYGGAYTRTMKRLSACLKALPPEGKNPVWVTIRPFSATQPYCLPEGQRKVKSPMSRVTETQGPRARADAEGVESLTLATS